MKCRRVLAILLCSAIMAGALSPAIFAGETQVMTAESYWTGGVWSWSNGPSSKALAARYFDFLSPWDSAFPQNRLVYGGYTLGQKSLGVVLSDGKLSIGSTSANAVNLWYNKKMTFLAGRTYGFFVEAIGITCKSNGTQYTNPWIINHVSFANDGTENEVPIKHRSEIPNYGDCYYFEITPTVDFAWNQLKIMYNTTDINEGQADEYGFLLGLSAIYLTLGDKDFTAINPTLDSIDKQVQEIQEALNPNVDYSDLDQSISDLKDVNKYLDDYTKKVMTDQDRFKPLLPTGNFTPSSSVMSFLWSIVDGITGLKIPISAQTTSVFGTSIIPGLFTVDSNGAYLSVGGLLMLSASIYGIRVVCHILGVSTLTSKSHDQEEDK